MAYCDMATGTLPLLMGYDPARHELLFATVFDTEAGLGRACAKVPAAQVVRPHWMVVRCDQIQLDDATKTRKLVLSVLGGGRLPDQGMSRAEVNRSATLFIQEAEGYLLRLQAEVQGTMTTTSPTTPQNDVTTSL
jgi:hypothetical protein